MKGPPLPPSAGSNPPWSMCFEGVAEGHFFGEKTEWWISQECKHPIWFCHIALMHLLPGPAQLDKTRLIYANFMTTFWSIWHVTVPSHTNAKHDNVVAVVVETQGLVWTARMWLIGCHWFENRFWKSSYIHAEKTFCLKELSLEDLGAVPNFGNAIPRTWAAWSNTRRCQRHCFWAVTPTLTSRISCHCYVPAIANDFEILVFDTAAGWRYNLIQQYYDIDLVSSGI